MSLSVVVASNNAVMTIEPCLKTLVTQCNRAEAELIVVDNSSDGTAHMIENQFSNVRCIRATQQKYIPELWGIGIAAAAGDVIAITTAHCVPADDWVFQIIEAHASDTAAGIGGAIENNPVAKVTDWAIYLCRYSRFMLPFQSTTVHDIAGDNASYKRWALERYRSAWRDGFWEPDVHAEILEEGGALRLRPQIIVRHVHSFDIQGFVHNRFEHGQQYGASRGAHLNMPQRLIHLLGAPLVPVLLVGRVAHAVLLRRRNVRPFLGALPLIGLFYASWAAGEVVGYMGKWLSR